MKVWLGSRVWDYESADVVAVATDIEGAKAGCLAHEHAEESKHHVVQWTVENEGKDDERHLGRILDREHDADGYDLFDQSYYVRPIELTGAIDFARKAATLGRRATNDPGAFTKRGPDYDGVPYGERLDQWQARALETALEQAVA